MKKNILKFLLVILMVVCFSSVKAAISAEDFTCGAGKGLATLHETSMNDPGEIQATLPICASVTQVGWTKVDNSEKYMSLYGGSEDFKDVEWVKTVGGIWQKIFVYRDDNKGVVRANVPICTDQNSKIYATTECKYKLTKNARWVCTRSCKEGGCCGGHYTCDGWSFLTRTTCYKWFDWTYETTAEDNDFLPLDTTGLKMSDAEAKCMEKNKTAKECKCDPDLVEYAYMCPKYKCNRGDVVVGVCTPSFVLPGGGAVYCVNPSQPFSAEYIEEAEYLIDSDFQIKDCESSYATVDCGYANILIEGEKYGLHTKVIELAMRLWSAHNNQAGYDNTGISNRRYNPTTGDCDIGLFIMPDDEDKVTNIYQKSQDYFIKELFENVKKIDKEFIDPVADADDVFKITCNKKLLGVVCGGTGDSVFDDKYYKQALALFANTALGNPRMQDDLNEMFEGEINEEIQTVRLVRDENETQYVEVYFEELEPIITTIETKEKINCKELDKYSAEDRKKIEPYCKISVSFTDGAGNPLTDLGGGTPAYCVKNYCRVKVESFAPCDIIDTIINSQIQIHVKHKSSPSNLAVTKYISCSNPRENQVMFGFNDDLSIPIKLLFPGSGDSYDIPIDDVFLLTDYKCAGRCDDYSLRTDIHNKCDDNVADTEAETYDKVYSSYIKDPSLKCILNMADSSYKSKYNYSEEFGLYGKDNKNVINNKLCKVYCSDEVYFEVADKVKEKSGRIFIYNVEEEARKKLYPTDEKEEERNKKNIRYYFSNMIQVKRTCVSEIYYNNYFTDSYDWKKIYDLGKTDSGRGSDGVTEEDISSINNFKTLFAVIMKKAQKEKDKTEILNKLLYDLYNCNLYTDDQIKDLGIKKPTDDHTGNIKKVITKQFTKEANYGIVNDDNCKVTKNGNTCITMNDIVYDFGGKTVDDKVNVEMKSYTENTNNFDKLIYCTGKECFAYDELAKDKEYDYPTGTTSKTETITLTNDTKNTAYLKGKKSVVVPANDYVMFEITTDVAFYNNSRFDVKPDGSVIKAGSGDSKEQYQKMESFLFPVNKNAYNFSTCTERDFLKNLKRCNIEQSYDKIKTYFRKVDATDFNEEINRNKKYACFVDVKKPGTTPPPGDLRDSTIYRNVDPAKIFPTTKDGYTPNLDSNWATERGHEVTDLVTASANELITTTNYLEYKITLTPTQIKNIQYYNRINDDKYINEAQYSCKLVDDTYQECTSPFMNELRANTEYGTIDPDYNLGKRKD